MEDALIPIGGIVGNFKILLCFKVDEKSNVPLRLLEICRYLVEQNSSMMFTAQVIFIPGHSYT